MDLLEKAKAMPIKEPPRKWKNYIPAIDELRTKGYTWRDITKFINENLNSTYTQQTVYYSYQRVAKDNRRVK
jgi:hypothetical protein